MEWFRRWRCRRAAGPSPAPVPARAPDSLWICLHCAYVADQPGPCTHCGNRYVQLLSVRLSALVHTITWFRSRNAELRARQRLGPVPLPNFLTAPGPDNWEVAPGSELLRVLRQPPAKKEK